MNNFDELLKSRLVLIKIIYQVFILSVLVITVIPFLVSVEKKEIPSIMPITFGVVALLCLVLSDFIPKKLFSSMKSKLPTQPIHLILSMLFPTIIIGCALKEAIAIFGLVLYFMTGDIKFPMIFGAISLLTIISSWPRFDEIKSKITNRSF